MIGILKKWLSSKQPRTAEEQLEQLLKRALNCHDEWEYDKTAMRQWLKKPSLFEHQKLIIRHVPTGLILCVGNDVELSFMSTETAEIVFPTHYTLSKELTIMAQQLGKVKKNDPLKEKQDFLAGFIKSQYRSSVRILNTCKEYEFTQWLIDNAHDDYYVFNLNELISTLHRNGHEVFIVWFKSEDDALRFKLTWAG